MCGKSKPRYRQESGGEPVKCRACMEQADNRWNAGSVCQPSFSSHVPFRSVALTIGGWLVFVSRDVACPPDGDGSSGEKTGRSSCQWTAGTYWVGKVAQYRSVTGMEMSIRPDGKSQNVRVITGADLETLVKFTDRRRKVYFISSARGFLSKSKSGMIVSADQSR